MNLKKSKPHWVRAINLDVARMEDGEPIAVLGFILADKNRQIDFYIGKNDVHALMKTLTNFVDFSEGRDIGFPTPH